jgi:hypothetical protein
VEKIKKDNDAFRKKLFALLNKHFYSTSKDEKEKIYSQIKALVLLQTDTEIENNKRFISMQSNRLKKIESETNEIEKNKQDYVEKKTNYFIEQYKDSGAKPL